MLPPREGSFRLFRFSGIDVSMHWSWFVAAAYFFSNRDNGYSSPMWNLAEYVALFVIVLMHEFGHSLACRSTGGRAENIVLWPLGGVAFVAPPPRAGAQLWSIAAGPLVNVALAPFFYLLVRVAAGRGLYVSHPDLFQCLDGIQTINLSLLVFNLLPVYPLDGGQILRSLLWFWVGPVNSLLVATGIGFLGGAGLVAYGLLNDRYWLAFMCGFLLLNCWNSFQYALRERRSMAALAREQANGGPPSWTSS